MNRLRPQQISLVPVCNKSISIYFGREGANRFVALPIASPHLSLCSSSSAALTCKRSDVLRRVLPKGAALPIITSSVTWGARKSARLPFLCRNDDNDAIEQSAEQTGSSSSEKGNQVNGGKVCSVYGIPSPFRLLFLGFVLYRASEASKAVGVLSSANKQCPRPLLSVDFLIFILFCYFTRKRNKRHFVFV